MFMPANWLRSARVFTIKGLLHHFRASAAEMLKCEIKNKMCWCKFVPVLGNLKFIIQAT